MKINNRTYLFIILMIFPISFLLQLFLVPNLPEKYFYDSYGILSIANGTGNLSYFDNSYLFTGNFFRIINIFKFTTFFEWSIFLTLITIPFIITFLKKYNNVSIDKLFFVIMTIVFFNVYIVRISKDYIQFLIWTIIYFIIQSKIRNTAKLIFSLVVFILEAIFFRSYYIAIGVLFIVIYIYMITNKKNIKIGKTLILTSLSIIIILTILQKYLPSIYNQIVNLRYNINHYREGSLDANTAINDLFNNSSPILYCINYFINLLRLLFPFELLLKGVKYIPFIIYQLYISIVFIKNIFIQKKNKNCFLAAIFISYMLISNLFEPDFGSFIRHEVSLLFILFGLMLGGKNNEKNIEKN